MRWRVGWDKECFAQLDGLIAEGVSIDQLKDAVRLVADELAIEPASKGHPLAEGLRRLDARPLRVYFHVDDVNQVVIVDGVTRHG
jgi:hypothetical protein